jgi:hypothetical protein
MPLYLMVVRRPLDSLAVPDGYDIELLGAYNDWPDVKENTRRFLYRLTISERSSRLEEAFEASTLSERL